MLRSVAKNLRSTVGLGLVAAAAAFLPGCFVAAAGAGAGSAIYLTTRGAESLVDASVSDVARAVDRTYDEMGIRVTGTKSEKSGAEREVKGEQGELDITTQFEREATGSTKIEVSARKNFAEWDKDFAKRVLEKIVERL